jgi:hypothetical protein
MRNATAQKLPLDDVEPSPSVSALPTTTPAATTGADDGADGLPPPTKAQVFYWAQLCGELTLRGTAGVADADGWSADLVPTLATLKGLQERNLVAWRDRAWKLCRDWYARLTALKARAVDTPVLGLAERPAPDLPTYAELEQWEAACRWLDAQPDRRARLPFVGLAPVLASAQIRADGGNGCTRRLSDVPIGSTGPAGPCAVGWAILGSLVDLQHEHEQAGRVAMQAMGEHAALLKAMRRYRLVRHTQSCEWVLSPRWREKLRDLHAGINRALREYTPSRTTPADARSLCVGLDTWGLNWLVEDDGDGGVLPARLHRQLEDYQELARAQEGEVETAWVYDGVPLRMYQAGVRAKGEGKTSKGASWSFILVNPSLRLLIRRVPLGGIVANARLGSECLWRRTPRAALDELHALIRRLWGKQQGRWQVSYAHLAHDVANAPLEREQLDRYVSRSRRRAVYDAAQADMQRLLREARPRDAAGAAPEGLDAWEWDVPDGEWDGSPLEEVFYDWEAEYAEDADLLSMDAFNEEGEGWDRTPWAVKQARAELDGETKERAITAYHWGLRLSGVTFSPGGAVSFVMYRKDWEGRLKQKRHMEPIWKAAGWDGREPVTRHEARLVREPLRELRLAGSDRPILDDPWTFLEHLADVWARMVGQADTCPEAVDVAWLRRVIPRERESNRSRWDTDPVWRVVQQAPFTPAPLAARRLVRRKQREQEVARLDKGILGYIAKREALLHPDPAGRDVTLALRDLVEPLDGELAAKGEPFEQAVRRKRQEAGLPIPLPAKVLPLRPRADEATGRAEQQVLAQLEQPLAEVAVDEAASAPPPCEVDAASSSGDGGGEPVPCEASGQWARWHRWAELRARSAELRMRQAYAALEVAETSGQVSPRELERLADVFAQESAACAAAEAMLADVRDAQELPR